MPRKKDIDAKQIIAYFRTAPLENAKLVLDLSKGEVQARSQKVEKPTAAAAPAASGPRRQRTAAPAAAPAAGTEGTGNGGMAPV